MKVNHSEAKSEKMAPKQDFALIFKEFPLLILENRKNTSIFALPFKKADII
jgi:hypothetical protein